MRQPLLLLALFGLYACRARPEPIPRFTLTLGWRLIPGTELKYRLTTRFHRGSDIVEREETWSYLVGETDVAGRYLLLGHLRDLDADMSYRETPLATSRLQPAIIRELIRGRIQGLQLTLTTDGRIPWTEAGVWSDALPHHLLALRLPDHAVTLGERWEDPDAARPYRGLFPFQSDDGEVGEQRLRAVEWRWATQPDSEHLTVDTTNLVAILETRAAIQAPDSVEAMLNIHGETTWNVTSGLMEHRLLEIWDRVSEDMDEESLFSMELEHIPE